MGSTGWAGRRTGGRTESRALRLTVAVVAALLFVSACTSASTSTSTPPSTIAPAPPPATSCDDGIKQRFRPDPRTSVLLVQAFPAGTPVALANTPADTGPGRPLPPTCAW